MQNSIQFNHLIIYCWQSIEEQQKQNVLHSTDVLTAYHKLVKQSVMDAMKVKIIEEKKKFQPFKVEITFESQWEAEFFGTLFNHTMVSNGKFKEASVGELCRTIRINLPNEFFHNTKDLIFAKD